MDSRTAEIYGAEEMREMLQKDNGSLRKAIEEGEIKQLEAVTPDEIVQGYADFETWAKALDLQLHTRQLRRNAERRYEKALKRGRK